VKQERILLCTLILLAFAQFVYYYPQLPATVPSHFDGRGVANGWSRKGQFFWGLGGVMALIMLTMLLPAQFFHRLPKSWLNLPHREYWTAPERWDQTAATLREGMFAVANASLLLFLIISQQAIIAALSGTNAIAPLRLWLPLGAYLAFITLWTIRFILRFYRRPADPAADPAERDRP